jgi:parvulin-like peptidyl-prolyl isomerase
MKSAHNQPPAMNAKVNQVQVFRSSFRVQSFVALLVIACLGSLAGCSRKQVRSDVLARVGTREITIADFDREVQWLQHARRPLPDKETLLQQMVAREQRLQKARATGLDKDPDVQRRYEAMLAGKVEELELWPQFEELKVAPAEIRALYEKEIARYTRPAKVRLALICIKTDSKISAEQLAQAETRIGEARKAALALPPGTHGLGAVAAEYSDEQASRYRGGDVGWFDRGRTEYRWPAEVVLAGFALAKTGDLSEVIRARGGFYIVSRLDSRDAVVTPFEQVQNSIQQRLLAEKRQQMELAFSSKMSAFAPAETFTPALAKVQYPTPTMAKAEDTRPPQLQGTTLSRDGKSSAN